VLANGRPLVLTKAGSHIEVWNALTISHQTRLSGVKNFDSFRNFSVSRDGRYLVAKTDDLIEIWDLRSGHRLRKEKEDHSFTSLDLTRTTPPGLAGNGDRYFVRSKNSAPPETALNEWLSSKLTGPRRVYAQPYAISSLDVSFDGKWLVTCGGDSALRLINAKNGKILSPKKDSDCSNARFGRNGAIFTIPEQVLTYEPVRMLDKNLRSTLFDLDYRPLIVKQLALSADGRTMLTAENDGRLRLWDRIKGEEKLVLPVTLNKESVPPVELVSRGRVAIVPQETGGIQGWSTLDGKLLFEHDAHKGQVSLIQRASDEDEFFLSVGGRSVRVWQGRKDKPILAIDGLPGVNAATLSGDALLLLVAGADSSVKIWDVKSGQMQNPLNVPGAIRSVAFSPDKTNFVAGYADGQVKVIAVNDGAVKREFRLPNNEPAILVKYIGASILTISRSGTTLWNTKGESSYIFNAGSPVITGNIFIDRQGSIGIANAGDGVRVGYLNRYTHKVEESRVFYDRPSSIAPSPDGQHVAVGYSSGWLRIWNSASHSRIMNFRVGDSQINKLEYAKNGRSLLIATDKGTLEEWDATTGEFSRSYGTLFGINDISFVGSSDQFVLIASMEGQLHIVDRFSGKKLCAMLLGKNGDWLVIRSDGLFDSTLPTTLKIDGSVMGNSSMPENNRYPGLLAAILNGKISPPLVASNELPDLPASTPIRLESAKVTGSLLYAPKPSQNSGSEPLAGSGLKWIVELFAGVFDAKDQLKVDDGLRIETSPNGNILIGTAALEKIVKGRSFGESAGLIAFIVAHEIQHSQQARQNRFGNLSTEDHRLLECQADVLGTSKAVALVATGFLGKNETLEAYGAIRNFPELVAVLGDFEGEDSFHPTKLQRRWAVEFGNARFFARHTEDKNELLMSDRRFDSRNPVDDDTWSQGVCKRLLNYRSDYQGNVQVSLRNERHSRNLWEGEVVYHNLSNKPLKISAHIRLVGTSFLPLISLSSSESVNIDGHLISFTLPPGGERIEPASLGVVELGIERFDPSGIIYTSLQNENWMSVELENDKDPASEIPGTKAANALDAQSNVISTMATCVDAEMTENPTAEQRELAKFLLHVATYASEDFRSLRRGNMIAESGPGANDWTSFNTDIRAPGSRGTATITVWENGKSYLSVSFGSDLTKPEADKLFNSLSFNLRGLCPPSFFKTKGFPDKPIPIEELSIPEFTKDTEVRLRRVDFRSTGTSTITLTIERKKQNDTN
jgi:WD40 repeat protein